MSLPVWEWIETPKVCPQGSVSQSLPVWECGLKLLKPVKDICRARSLPVWECGLKRIIVCYMKETHRSLPVWECELKLCPASILKKYDSHSPCGSVD